MPRHWLFEVLPTIGLRYVSWVATPEKVRVSNLKLPSKERSIRRRVKEAVGVSGCASARHLPFRAAMPRRCTAEQLRRAMLVVGRCYKLTFFLYIIRPTLLLCLL